MIYNLGMPRTGTTSLTKAIGLLYPDLEHIKHEASPQHKWDKLCNGNYMGGLCYHYVGLDNRNDGTFKFIYTYRPVDKWLESIKKVFNSSGPTKSSYDISNMVPKILSTPVYDEDYLRVIFNQHQAGVLNYFKGRSDFLAFDVKTGWDALCRFLDKPIPNQEFPHHS